MWLKARVIGVIYEVAESETRIIQGADLGIFKEMGSYSRYILLK